MIPLAVTPADSVLAATALAGTLGTIVVIRARSVPDGLAARFIFALVLVAGILATRLLAWHLNAAIFDVVGRLIAAWIPLAALVLLEGLQRRHAPREIKIAMLAGGVLCTVLAFFPADFGYPLYILLAVQVAALAAVYWLSVTGSRDGLTTSEYRAILRLRIALPILLVCLASDYGLFAQWVPLRASSIAILFFCWVAIGSAAATASRWDAALVLAATLVVAVLVGVAAGASTGSNAVAVQIGAMVLCASILALVINEAARAFASSRRDDVLSALAEADMSSAERFMSSVTSRSQLQGTTIIEGEALADFDAAALNAAFAAAPVMDRRDLAPFPDEVRQQLESLFVTYDATHLMSLSASPLRLAAATLAAVGSNEALKTELALVQRMAVLVSRQEARTDGTA